MLIDILSDLNIKYDLVNHKEIYTIEDANNLNINIDGIGTKNLFIKDDKNYYICIINDSKKLNFKLLKKIFNKKITFGTSEELYNLTKLKPGYVSLFGIINDVDNKITILIDKELVNKKMLQPFNSNTKTINIDYINCINFIKYCKHDYVIIDMEEV